MSYMVIMWQTNNTYSLTGAPSTKVSRDLGQKLIETQGKADKSIITAGNFTIHLPDTHTPCEQKSRLGGPGQYQLAYLYMAPFS